MKFLPKLIIMFLIVGLNYSGIFAVSKTMAFYSDTELSEKNPITAGAVDFSLIDLGFSQLEQSINLEPNNTASKGVEINTEIGSGAFQYLIKSDNFGGDEAFCDALSVEVSLSGYKMYSGVLRSFTTQATTTTETVNLKISKGANNFQNKVCDFDVVYDGWQTRHNYPNYENGGFSDTEKVSSTISSWGFRINKVYYDVADNRGVEGANEWVEIYNQTNTDLDISGWSICDSNSCDVIPSNSDLIPAEGYAVITASSTTWDYWFVPSEISKIVLGDIKIGNGLANDGDAIYLKRPDGIVVDEMNWQGNTDVWSSGANAVAEGSVLTRITNGFDTDQASDWKELVPPNVDLINPDEVDGTECGENWYWGDSYEIKWTAENMNGDDADLAIDLYYIKDINLNKILDEADTTHVITKNTANDGSFLWTIPSGFEGYIWVKLVATGSENPMLNSTTISSKVWDPAPPVTTNYIAPENTNEEYGTENETSLDTYIPIVSETEGAVTGETDKNLPVEGEASESSENGTLPIGENETKNTNEEEGVLNDNEAKEETTENSGDNNEYTSAVTGNQGIEKMQEIKEKIEAMTEGFSEDNLAEQQVQDIMTEIFPIEKTDTQQTEPQTEPEQQVETKEEEENTERSTVGTISNDK